MRATTALTRTHVKPRSHSRDFLLAECTFSALLVQLSDLSAHVDGPYTLTPPRMRPSRPAAVLLPIPFCFTVGVACSVPPCRTPPRNPAGRYARVGHTLARVSTAP